jgi:hypothetical protein
VIRRGRELGHYGLDIPVVNASFPDATHSILAPLGLAPLVGLGNVAMIAARIQDHLTRQGGEDHRAIRVVAHHAHVVGSVTAQPHAADMRPWVLLGDAADHADHLAYVGPPLAVDASLNELTARTALPLLRAILTGEELQTCAPGPLGLPGGYPVRLHGRRVEIDLPSTMIARDAIAANERWQRLDGIEEVTASGEVRFTRQARLELDLLHPALSVPLLVGTSLARFEALSEVLGNARVP